MSVCEQYLTKHRKEQGKALSNDLSLSILVVVEDTRETKEKKLEVKSLKA